MVTVFTCAIGATDVLRPPSVINRQCRYLAFSDRPSVPHPYRLIPVPTPATLAETQLLARQIKIQANRPELGTSSVLLWHDASFRLDCDPATVVTTYLQAYDVLAFAHPHRHSIEEEAEVIAAFGYSPKETLDAQLQRYRADGFGGPGRLTTTGFCVRRMTDRVRAFNALWWSEVERWSWRDQMSVDYAIWKTGVKFGYLPGHYRDNRFVKFHLQYPARVIRRPMVRP